MDFINTISSVFNNYADFEGRAKRSDFWYFIGLYLVINMVLLPVMNYFPEEEKLQTIYILITIFYIVFQVGFIIPIISLSVRRLHDIGKSGWFILIALIPIIGNIALIVLYLKKSQNSSNHYGPVPIGAN